MKIAKMAPILLCWMHSEKNNLLEHTQKTIEKICLSVGRTPDSVSILAVSKNKPIENILPLIEAGHRLFGENRVQEATQKWFFLRQSYPNVRLHLIGPLQRNKIKQALSLFDVIETIDRPHLVLSIAKEWLQLSHKTEKLLIQVNTGREPQKSGVHVEDLASLVDLCKTHCLPLTGLMCIPPLKESPEPHFQLLSELAHQHGLHDLSMGMSRDYPTAIAHGATWIRLGKALWP